MRDWVTDIEDAMARGDSPFNADDLLRWLRDGSAHMVAAPHLHGSVRYYEGGDAEVGHMAGEWCAHCADYVITGLKADAKERGIESVRIEGRKGWKRFLEIKGVL